MDKKKICIIVLVIIVLALVCFFIFRPKPFAENDGVEGVVTFRNFSGTVGYMIGLKEGENVLESNLEKGSYSFKIINGGNVYAECDSSAGKEIKFNMEKAGLYLIEFTCKRTTGTIKYELVEIAQTIDELPIELNNNEEQEALVKDAVEKQLKKAFEDKLEEVKFTKVKIYSVQERKEIETLNELKEDDIVFEVEYELKPSKDVDPIIFTAATGEVDEETGWVTEKSNVGTLIKNEDGEYDLENFGTGF
jgi:hypothetical protein